MPATKKPKPEQKPAQTFVGGPLEWFTSAFAKGPTESQRRDIPNIWFRVGVMKDIPPSDARFEYVREMGSAYIEPILLHEQFHLQSELTFVFPERHMSVHDEHAFIYMLVKHPQIRAAKMTTIDVITKSPLIVGSFRRDDIRIFSQPHDNERNRKLHEAHAKADLIPDVRGNWKAPLNEVEAIAESMKK